MMRAAPALFPVLAAATSGCAASSTQTACVEHPVRPAEAPQPVPPLPSPAQTPSLPLDLPSAASWTGIQTPFTVDLDAAGQVAVDGERLTSEDALQAKARVALAQHPELRAVVRADQSVSCGRVIHVVDHLKLAGVSSVAFGVYVSPTPGPVVIPGLLPALIPEAKGGGSPARLLSGASSWTCPFPPEADKKGIDSAVVAVEVIVGADGAPTGARVVGDPGNGFGQAALRCAVARQYVAATDARGVATRSATAIRVQFTR